MACPSETNCLGKPNQDLIDEMNRFAARELEVEHMDGIVIGTLSEPLPVPVENRIRVSPEIPPQQTNLAI